MAPAASGRPAPARVLNAAAARAAERVDREDALQEFAGPVLDQLNRALILNPESHETHLIVALAHLQRGDLDAAETSLRETLTLRIDDTAALAALALVHMRRGAVDEARGIEKHMRALAAARYVSPADFAKLYVDLDETDLLFEWMERAYAERRGWLAYLRVEPLLDSVRDDPRFGLFLERMRLT